MRLMRWVRRAVEPRCVTCEMCRRRGRRVARLSGELGSDDEGRCGTRAGVERDRHGPRGSGRSQERRARRARHDEARTPAATTRAGTAGRGGATARDQRRRALARGEGNGHAFDAVARASSYHYLSTEPLVLLTPRFASTHPDETDPCCCSLTKRVVIALSNGAGFALDKAVRRGAHLILRALSRVAEQIAASRARGPARATPTRHRARSRPMARPRRRPTRRGAAELLAGLADYDPALLRRALLGEAGSGAAGRDLLADAIECAEDEAGG